MLSPGDTFGRYAIDAVLGEGGMGRVYRAEDTVLARRVALKILHVDDADTKKRMLREARAAAALNHPNAVSVFDVGEIDGVPFLAMEYLDGKPLRAYVGDASAPVSLRVRWLKDIARALAAAHGSGLVHRDVKPENVFVTERGDVKVLDFGIARRSAEVDVHPPLTTTGGIVGTPRYMAPEQMLGEAVDGRADQFAWGVVAFELMTGAFPWGAPSDAVNVIARVMADSRERLVGRSGVPEGVARVVDRALEREPSARFASMHELVDALERIATDATVRGDPPPSAKHAANAPKRARWRLALGGALVLGVGAAAIGFASRAGPGARSDAPPSSGVADAASSAPRPSAITDFAASVRTESPEAAALYAGALQKIRDGAPNPAVTDLRRAIKLDPAFAAAHLRILCNADPRDLDNDRRRVVTVAALRAKLSERDLALFSLCGLLLNEHSALPPSEAAAAAAKAREVADAFPLDAEITINAAWVLFNADARGDAERYTLRAHELDPRFQSWSASTAYFRFFDGDVDGYVAALDACIAASPGATDCISAHLWMDAALGRCERYEAMARRLQAAAPGESWYNTARALAMRGAPIETVRDALLRAPSSVLDSVAARSRLSTDAAVALLKGDLDAAQAALEAAAERDYASTTDETAAETARNLIETALEAGEISRAVAAAKRYLDTMHARTDNASSLARPLALQLLRREGLLSEEKLRAAREELLQNGRMFWPRFGRSALFYDVYAGTAYTSAEALEALDALPRFLPLPKAPFYTPRPSGEHDGYVGRVMGIMYFLAGRVDDAIPHLRRGVAACDILGATVEQMRAHVALAGALEAKGDKPGACDAYRVVLARWPAPKPRSVSVDTARARVKALGCAR